MKAYYKILFILFAIICLHRLDLLAQECTSPFARTFGSLIDESRGYCVVASPAEHVVYIGGLKNDSVSIIRLNAAGDIDWIHTFDIETGVADNLNGIILDSEGMLGLAGSSGDFSAPGTVFVFRYDPATNTVLWAKQVSSTSENYCSGLIEMGSGGNYLLFNNPVNPNDAELLELDRNTGTLNPDFSKHYDLGSSETMYDIVFHQEQLYAAARYTDGSGVDNMRNTLVKMDAADGDVNWALLGHRPASVSARLYTIDLVIHEDKIYSVVAGDPDGASIDFTQIFIQKTALDGSVEWLKQYELPAQNDWVDEIMVSDGGLVVLGRNRVAPSDIYLFKINTEGEMLWSWSFDFGKNDNSVTLGGVTSQLAELDDHLYFTAGSQTGAQLDMLLVKTNLDGELSDSCGIAQQIIIPVENISTDNFYFKETDVFTYIPEINDVDLHQGDTATIFFDNLCGSFAITSDIHFTICDGESYAQYTEAGIFIDTFQIAEGCDSIRTLTLIVEDCSCNDQYGAIYGTPNHVEGGYSIAATSEGDGAYVAGIKDDSTLLIKINLRGEVMWARTFDVMDGFEYPHAMIVDDNGMIAIGGTSGNQSLGGPIYMLQYNPVSDQLIWAKEYLSSENNYVHSLIQKDDGNYILATNPHYHSANHLDTELLEIDPATGNVVPGQANHYIFFDTESLFDIAYDDGFIYGAGRYKFSGELQTFRNTIAKLDDDDGSQLWTIMGQTPMDELARLYGAQILIDGDFLITTSYGDPNGTSATDTELYLQKTNKDGEVIWMKQYDLAGTRVFANGLIKSEDGYVILANHLAPEQEFVLIKTDLDGNLLWSRSFQFPASVSTSIWQVGKSKLIQAGNKLMFTATSTSDNGDTDMIIVRTGTDGQSEMPCVTSDKLEIPTIATEHGFFNVTPTLTIVEVGTESIQSDENTTVLTPIEECFLPGSVDTLIAVTICTGGSFEGHTESGIYIDTLVSVLGCDSIREIRLDVLACDPIVFYDLNACTSFMSDNSHMDYSEFTPQYPQPLACADVSAGIVHRTPAENKHSCTPGLHNSDAMCISSLESCTYDAGNNASLVMEITIDPPADSIVHLTGLQFYEKAPQTYNWISGDSGPNNYPTLYGIRILKNGTEIYREEAIATSTAWTLQSYDFISDDNFIIDAATTFRVELLPYCPVGNGAVVSAWDIEEISFFAGCVPFAETLPIVHGNVTTKQNQPLKDAFVMLSQQHDFYTYKKDASTNTGAYEFAELGRRENYFLKCNKNSEATAGVSTLDLIMIQKHLLGIQSFTSLEQFVAADANHDGVINVQDLLELRKLLLGKYEELPKNTSWRFGVLPQDFSGSDPSALQEVATIESLENDTTRIDFVGIKIGDVNGDIQLEATGSSQDHKLNFEIDGVERYDASIVAIDIIASSQLELEGLQFALDFHGLELIRMESKSIIISKENYGFEKGILRVSWHDALLTNQFEPGTILFQIIARSHKSARLSDMIKVSNDRLLPEMYSANHDDRLIMRINTTSSDPSGIHHFRVEPNPVSSSAVVSFYLQEKGIATIRFFDATGMLISAIEKSYEGGDNTETIDSGDFPLGERMVYCQIVSKGYTQTQKVVILR